MQTVNNDDVAEGARPSASRKKKKYKRYSKIKHSWKKEKQVPEIEAMRAVGIDGKVKAPTRDYLILTFKKGSTAETDNSKIVYDLMGCAACQVDVLRKAHKAKSITLGTTGIAAGAILGGPEVNFTRDMISIQPTVSSMGYSIKLT